MGLSGGLKTKEMDLAGEAQRFDVERWRAVSTRDSSADGAFFYGVRTTKIFCRPSCGSRLPLRKNIVFFDDVASAVRAGYRPCKKCQPDCRARTEKHVAKVVEACRLIEQAQTEPKLEELARGAGLSPWHFNRVFKRVVGLTPKQYALGVRSKKIATAITTDETITSAIYVAGFENASTFYEQAKERQGMTPSQLRRGGEHVVIRYEYGRSTLGQVIIAATDRGLCAVLFGPSQKVLLEDLTARFPKADLQRADAHSDFARWVEATIEHLDGRTDHYDLPLDVRGTAFQEQVWQALRRIKPGETASYADIAQSIGRPKAVRAVAGACAANPLAIIIPCHRVVRSDGAISGYRWGRERKKRLLRREKTL